MTIIKHLLQSI